MINVHNSCVFYLGRHLFDRDMIVQLANMRKDQVVPNKDSYAMMCIKNTISKLESIKKKKKTHTIRYGH